MYIDGEWIESIEGKYFETYNPANGETIGMIPEGTREDAQKAIDAAVEAAPRIASMSVWERSALLKSIASKVESKKEELARIISIDQGKPYYTEALPEVEAVIRGFSDAAEQIKWLETAVIPVQDKNKRVFSIYQPKGVYAIITPWNFPMNIPTEYLAPALGAGNTVVWVPAPTTSISAIKLMECLVEAGVPKGVVNLVTGMGAVVGDEIVVNPGTNAIGFTGSTAVGYQIATSGAGKPLLLELGGNGPTIVLKDADLDKAAKSIAAACFFNGGQVCSSSERILVHQDIHDAFVERLLKEAKAVVLGDPLDPLTTMGPLNNIAVVEKNVVHANDSREKGANILIGGQRATGLKSELFFEPTVITNVTEEFLYNMEETFGPVAPVMSFSTNQEAIEIADRNKWGLVCSVFTESLKDSMFFAERLRAGIVNVNENSNYWEPHIPFGGVAGKTSGIGRIGGTSSIKEMSDVKTICLDLG
jgi:acyl-CoA reductase-like NAD-dependent aldehyde dehydrogenase